MGILEMIEQSGGLSSVAHELGISETKAATAASVLVPAIVGGLKRQAQAQPGGLDGLLGALAGLGGGSLLDEVLAPRPTNVQRGNEVLGQIFGSKDVSRTVAQHAAGSTGIDPELLKRMLPMLAMLVAGLASRHGTAAAMPPEGGAALSPGGGHGGLSSLLDLNGDGDPLDDILAMAGKLLG
jgi:hypothetical protein